MPTLHREKHSDNLEKKHFIKKLKKDVGLLMPLKKERKHGIY